MRFPNWVRVGIFLAIGIHVASCGGPPQPPSGSTATPIQAAQPATPTRTAISSAPTAVATPYSPTPSGPPIVVGSPGSGEKELVLADAFNAGDWTEGSYTPANETAAVRAMATEVYCNSRQSKDVEYRFAQVEGRLTVQVAQDMRSASPDMELEFSLTADGRQVDVKNADFKGKPELSTELAGVTVLRIGVKPAPGMSGQCKSSQAANALLTSVVIQQ